MNRLLSFLFLAVFALLFSCNTTSDKSVPEDFGLSSDTLTLAEQSMQTFIDSNVYAGIVVRTIIDGETAHNACFGYSDIESQVPIKDSDIFRIFSMTKPVVASGLMTLYDEGKFELDDPIYEWIPAFEMTKVYTPGDDGFTLEDQESPITIRHLLTHTSGLSYGFDPSFYIDSLYMAANLLFNVDPLDITISKLASLPLVNQPGTTYRYSLSIDVAGYLIEVISGQKLDEFMEERFFDPLKMDDTGFYVPEEEHGRLVSMYTSDGGTGITLYDDFSATTFAESFKSPPVNLSGGAGLVSTVSDYGRFAQMLLNGGELEGVRVLEESTVDMIMSDQLPEGVNYGGENMAYGLGGFVNKLNGRYGWSGAASTDFTVFPEDNMVTLAFSQLFWANGTFAWTYKNYVQKAIIEE